MKKSELKNLIKEIISENVKLEKYPVRVWIDSPSKFQPYYKYNGINGLAVILRDFIL